MYINRTLLLLLGVLVIFLPALADWLTGSPTAWYRPYQAWLVVVVAAWWNQRSRYPDEL
tara:strand:+ start:623 stop:799 length:177 start_codon:yes stop_codon:yes gene_type:complete